MSSQVSIICPPDLSQRPFSANRRTHDAGVANCPVSGVDRTDGLLVCGAWIGADDS
jgi:hypothetical protein